MADYGWGIEPWGMKPWGTARVQPWIKIAGVWRESIVWLNINGTWQQVASYVKVTDWK